MKDAIAVLWVMLPPLLMFAIGVLYGIARERRSDNRQFREIQKLRRSQYTRQICVECGNGKIYPAMCDTCGARWIADMHLEGSPRRPLNGKKR